MSYYFTKTINRSFEQAITDVTLALKEKGFGIITEIDVKQTFKTKLDKVFRPYRILGACNPTFAYKVLNMEDKVGLMLPCNVIVQQHDDGTVEVTAVDPEVAMAAIKNKELEKFSCEVGGILQEVIENL
jgi:uncharacterized protein (DUF302 family)